MRRKKYSFRRRILKVNKSTKKVVINGRKFKLLKFNNIWVFPEIQTYMNGLGSPIAMSLLIYEDESLQDYLTVTVNLPDCRRSAGCQFIDTNHNKPYLVKWLIKNKFGKLTGHNEKSGYCTYPEFNFYVGERFRYFKAINDEINKWFENESEDE